MKEFFFDTADLEFIKKTTEKLEGKIDFKLIKGVTTNPNAFNKIDKHSMYQWVEIAEEIGNFLYDLRQDNKGEVHIQLPNANLKIDHAVKFANFISKLPKSKMTVGMKIPPYQEILTNLEELNKTVLTNVTGVSDHATALKCITYDVNYVSIIPGRMEEVGIPALELLSYLFQAKHKKTKIISGSMRTIDQLKYTFQIGTIPTLAKGFGPLVLDNNTLDQLLNLDYSSVKTTTEFSPEISKKSFDLSKDFFTQMNELGKFANDELLDL